jgi:hypothetical protein
MKLLFTSRKTRVANLSRSLLLGGCAALCPISPLAAQTNYTVIDLTAPGSYGNALAAGNGQAAGMTSNSASELDATRAALWTSSSFIDLHPALLGDPASSTSMVQALAGNLQVGWGIGPNSGMQSAPIAWRSTAQSATFLAVPFATYGAQALGTDGLQIVGFAGALKGRSGGPYHALVWNAITGAAVDLGDGGNGARALGVGRGQQVGFTTRSSGSVATIWSGTSRSQLVIHPTNALTSEAWATDGSRQVGFSGVDVKVVDEAAKGKTTRRINTAMIWNGTAASARTIHPTSFTQSYATGIAGSTIVGYAFNGYGLGTEATYHAIRWNANLQPTDLNAFLPAGFTGAMASSVDAQGNIAGTIFTADGLRHAAVWIPTAN